MNIVINVVGFLMIAYASLMFAFGPEASHRSTVIKTFFATLWNYKWVWLIWFLGAILMDVKI